MWTDVSKFKLVKFDVAQKVWEKEGGAFKLSCIQGTVKFCGGNLIVWGSMTWNGTGKLEFIDGIMDSEVYANTLNKNFLASTRKLRRGKHFVFQQDNDPKQHQRKQTFFIFRSRLNYLNGKLKVQISFQLNTYGLFCIKSWGTMSQKERRAENLTPRSLDSNYKDTTKNLVESMQN